MYNSSQFLQLTNNSRSLFVLILPKALCNRFNNMLNLQRRYLKLLFFQHLNLLLNLSVIFSKSLYYLLYIPKFHLKLILQDILFFFELSCVVILNCDIKGIQKETPKREIRLAFFLNTHLADWEIVLFLGFGVGFYADFR